MAETGGPLEEAGDGAALAAHPQGVAGLPPGCRGAHPDEVLFLLYHSALRPVQERLRNYFQKYLPMVQEITPEEWAAAESRPGHRHGSKARDEYITTVLDRRPKKPEPVVAPPVVEVGGAVRRAR